MGKRYLKVAVVYFAIAVTIGILMGITQKFMLASVHAHVNLLGWVSMALMGLIYHFYPKAGETKLSKVQFWVYNISFPIFQGFLALEILGVPGVVVIVILGSLVTYVGILLFVINVLKNLNLK